LFFKEVMPMRLDKFLKVSRLFKRRTVAKDIADHDRVYVNDRLAKPSTEIKEGDAIRIVYGSKVLVLRAALIADQTKKEDAAKMYEIISETKIDPALGN
jgi:ribosomal 50S subunit-recycling heat shock protein